MLHWEFWRYLLTVYIWKVLILIWHIVICILKAVLVNALKKKNFGYTLVTGFPVAVIESYRLHLIAIDDLCFYNLDWIYLNVNKGTIDGAYGTNVWVQEKEWSWGKNTTF